MRKEAKPVEPKKKAKKGKPGEGSDGKLVTAGTSAAGGTAQPEPVGAGTGTDTHGTAP